MLHRNIRVTGNQLGRKKVQGKDLFYKIMGMEGRGRRGLKSNGKKYSKD